MLGSPVVPFCAQIAHDPAARVVDHPLAHFQRCFGAEVPQSVGLGDEPTQLGVGAEPQRVLKHRQPQMIARSQETDQVVRLVVEIVDQLGRQVLRQNASGRQLLAELRLGQVGMTSEGRRPMPDGGVERQIFKRVQRVVMDKDPDRCLVGQQMGGVLDRMRDRLQSLRDVTRLQQGARKRCGFFHS